MTPVDVLVTVAWKVSRGVTSTLFAVETGNVTPPVAVPPPEKVTLPDVVPGLTR